MNLGILLVLIAATAMASEPVSRSARIARLEETLLAPCCWSETVAVHRSPVALEIKSEIASFVRQGKIDREILDYYKAKYGVRILTEPEGAARVLANVVPWVAAALGALGVALAIRRMARRNAKLKVAAGSELPDLADDDW
jgi:cytochrome c-type biogenesis protein CcmH/NrfF